jgi:hypothetical protein
MLEVAIHEEWQAGIDVNLLQLYIIGIGTDCVKANRFTNDAASKDDIICRPNFYAVVVTAVNSVGSSCTLVNLIATKSHIDTHTTPIISSDSKRQKKSMHILTYHMPSSVQRHSSSATQSASSVPLKQ